MKSTQELERYKIVADFFCTQDKKFKQKGIKYAGNPKIAIHVFNNQIKDAISKGAGLQEFGPDFSIVKKPNISSNIGGQIIDFTDKTQFSLWRIINEKEILQNKQEARKNIIFPFTPVIKNNKVMRVPEFRLPPLDCWEIVSPLLVR